MTCKKCGQVAVEPWSGNELEFCQSCQSRSKTHDYGKPVELEKNAKSVNEVAIIDVNMPFMSMVVLLVKLALAAIPALIILMFIGFIFSTFITSSFSRISF
jgi:hypothetical protein